MYKMNISKEFSGEGPLNCLRLGIHAERKYFEKVDLFRGIVFNGTIIALTPKATATFLTTVDKPFWIDPLTYAFERSPIHILREDGGVKRSIRKLVQFFGSPLKEIVGKKALSPDQFRGRKTKEGFCNKVLSFQRNILVEAMSENLEYCKEIGLDISQVVREPMVIIPPYFYLDINSWEYWIDLNVEFVKIALMLGEKIPIFCEIVFSKALLHDEQNLLDKIAERYRALDCQGFLIWVSDFPEYRASVNEILSLRKFIKKLKDREKPIINLYGGYLSALLFFDGLTGFCHGPGYGEDRDIVPIGGGLPYPKYYFTPLHRRILTEQVEWFIKASRLSVRDFCSQVCDCEICKGTLQNSIDNFAKFGEKRYSTRTDGLPFSYATERAKELNNRHYLYAKQKEILDITSLTKQESLSKLKDAEKKYIHYFSSEGVSHLGAWHRALSQTI